VITLDGSPRNGAQFVRLTAFLKEILDICRELNIEPIVAGSLAVFAHTKNHDMVVNDVDLAVPEGDYPRIVEALSANGIRHRLREWHVLQVCRDELRVELDSAEHWHKGLQILCDTLRIGDATVKILSLDGLKELYRRGVEDTARHIDEGNNRRKNESYAAKSAALDSASREK
jgi:hypothetical protein